MRFLLVLENLKLRFLSKSQIWVFYNFQSSDSPDGFIWLIQLFCRETLCWPFLQIKKVDQRQEKKSRPTIAKWQALFLPSLISAKRWQECQKSMTCWSAICELRFIIMTYDRKLKIHGSTEVAERMKTPNFQCVPARQSTHWVVLSRLSTELWVQQSSRPESFRLKPNLRCKLHPIGCCN